jgi:transcriptional regulator with XRE-family HTH domain
VRPRRESRTGTVALPFTKLQLQRPRPAELPRGYPIELRTIGDHLRRRRLELGLLQRTVAQQLGVSVEAIALWEKGRVRPRPRQYRGVIEFLGYDPEPTPPSVSGRLASLRRHLGLTQAEFAYLVGLDEGSVCRWESGSRQPSRWMETRVKAILAELERRVLGSTSAPSARLTFADRTRWRRRLPPDLTVGKPKTFGEQIRERRLKLGLSQAELGAQFGVGRGTIRRWERGAATPMGVVVLAIEQFLRRKI